MCPLFELFLCFQRVKAREHQTQNLRELDHLAKKDPSLLNFRTAIFIVFVGGVLGEIIFLKRFHIPVGARDMRRAPVHE